MKLLYKVFTAIFLIVIFTSPSFVTSLVFAAGVISSQPVQSSSQAVTVGGSGGGLSVRIAPGELLPVRITLSNFGGGKEVDVLVTYEVLDDRGVDIYVASQTVAVETTASFVKTIPIPNGTPSGEYIAKTSIAYLGQTAPASTQFSFAVEDKVIGLFEGDFFLYSGITLVFGMLMVFLAHAFMRRQKVARLTPLDYSNIPQDKRIFFELLSDTIMAMRLKAGDVALDIAAHIDGLLIDTKTGRVLKITDEPSKIIALLVSGYEKALGKKVSFSFREKKKEL